MKIEIDLKDILHDEYGDAAETMAQSIRRQVVEALVKSTAEGVQRQIKEQTSRVIDETLAAALREKLPGLISDMLETEYQPVDTYGRRGSPTTLRGEIVRSVTEQMVYKPGRYDSDKNAFTKTVDGAVADKLDTFRKEWTKQVDAQFVAHALAYATEKMRERLGLPKATA